MAGSLCCAANAMISLRLTYSNPVDVTTRPPPGWRAKAAMDRSMSPALRALTGLTSTWREDAPVWIGGK